MKISLLKILTNFEKDLYQVKKNIFIYSRMDKVNNANHNFAKKGGEPKAGTKTKHNNQSHNRKSKNNANQNPNVINFGYQQQDDYIMEQEHNNYGNQQLQCQEKINMQLYLRRQKNYSDTFKSCYNAMKDYIKNPFQSKGNFVWTLECYCSMVDLWKRDYPEYEPQLSKEFNKEKIKLELKNYEKQTEKNKNYESKLFHKFYKLVNNEKQNLEDEKVVLSYFPEVQPNETNIMSNAANLININRKVENDIEKEEFYGYPNFDVDPKLKHLRPNK